MYSPRRTFRELDKTMKLQDKTIRHQTDYINYLLDLKYLMKEELEKRGVVVKETKGGVLLEV